MIVAWPRWGKPPAVAFLFMTRPQLIKDQYNLLLKDAEDNSLKVLKKYLEDHILPDKSILHGIARIGNFGEVLASTIMIEFENFWFPIYKLRFGEKKDWAMRLTDLCLIEEGRQRKNRCHCRSVVE